MPGKHRNGKRGTMTGKHRREVEPDSPSTLSPRRPDCRRCHGTGYVLAGGPTGVKVQCDHPPMHRAGGYFHVVCTCGVKRCALHDSGTWVGVLHRDEDDSTIRPLRH